MPGVKGRSGRKSKAEEMGLAALLDKCWGPRQRMKVVTTLYEIATDRADRSCVNAASLLLAYGYGKPTERIEQKVTINPQIETATMALMAILRQQGSELDVEMARSLVVESYQKAGYTQELDTTA